MPVNEKEGTQAVPVIDNLEIRLGSLAPIYKGRVAENQPGFPEMRLILYPDNNWYKLPDHIHGVKIDETELDALSSNPKSELYFAVENDQGLEFHLYIK